MIKELEHAQAKPQALSWEPKCIINVLLRGGERRPYNYLGTEW